MRSVTSLVLLALSACDAARATIDAATIDTSVPGGVDAASPPTPDDAPVPPGTDAYAPSGTDAFTPVTPDAATPPVAFCRVGCGTPTDCATPSVALYDAGHYRCTGSLCEWTGCRDDAECRAAFSRSDYACRDVGGLPQCVDTCATSAECGSGSAAFDADNYDCLAGECVYRGCRDDSECASTFSSSRYVCRRASLPDTGLPIPSAERNCVLGCTSASDCVTSSGAFDADNYECNAEGACVYTGCHDDAECRASFMADRYVCR